MGVRTAVRAIGMGLGMSWMAGCSLPFAQNAIPANPSGVTLPSQLRGARAAPANAPFNESSGYNFAAACDTGSYVAGIEWPGEQPLLTLWQVPSPILVNKTTAAFSANPANSETYTVAGTPRAVVTFRSDLTCNISATDVNGSTIVSQNGQTRFDNSLQPSPGPTVTPTATPTVTPTITPIPTPSPSPITPTPIPSGATAISCRGTIQNRVDFTVFYGPGQGFYRIDLRPPGGNTISTQLFPSGSDGQGRPVFRGFVNAAAEVAVVQGSLSPPRAGDQVFVRYDTATGTGVCGSLPALW